MKSARGFSLVELVVATALTLGVAALVFATVGPSESVFAARTEQTDLQQRLRVASDLLVRELHAAGAGPSAGAYQGPLTRAFAAVLPSRIGEVSSIGTATSDVLTIISVPPTFAQTTLSSPLTASSGTIGVQLDPGCPIAAAACGFLPGMTAVVFDGTGAFDTFIVHAVGSTSVTLEHVGPSSGWSYPAGSGLVEAHVRVFSRRIDAGGVEQLVRETGIGDTPVPVIDHVVGLSFRYFGDPVPPRIRIALADEPATTYGPVPPVAGIQTTQYPPGENCVFAGAGTHVPRLAALLPDTGGLVALDQAVLSDGPWCPDASHPLRFDADLLRVRRVSASIRVQTAVESLRGPAGPLFSRGGTSRDARRWLPDIEVSVAVAPQNLSLVMP